MNIATATIYELKEKLESKEISSVELVQAYLDRIKEHDSKIHAFLEVFDDALLHAKAIDQVRSKGDNTLGPLAGIPLAIKDNILIQGKIASAGSKILENHVAGYDATITARLREAGAVFLGRTNCDTFAMGSSCENSDFGPTMNPWNTKMVPGGSSGGSAAAVASGFAPAAFGTDTGGSVRLPGSLSGVIGLKPTYGRVSRYGLVALGSSLDQPGPLTRTIEDAALLLEVIDGGDTKDATSANDTDKVVPELLGQDIKGMKIGLPKEYFAEGLNKEVEKLVREAAVFWESKGAELVEVSLPYTEYAIATYYMIMCSEASSNLARYDGIRYGLSEESKELEKVYQQTRGKGFGDEAKRRIMLGTYALSSGYYDAYYKKALQVRTQIYKDFEQVFEQVDCIMGPVSPTTAWPIGEKVDDPLTMYLGDIYTISVNLTGLPGISLPCGFSDDLPVGVQLVGKAFDELTLFRLAKAYQAEHDWHLRDPLA